ncbi:MAG: hypothetical protein WC223_02685 [Bacteroidales bacterium]|jgi:tetratricopeptide (TPR) repeat protein
MTIKKKQKKNIQKSIKIADNVEDKSKAKIKFFLPAILLLTIIVYSNSIRNNFVAPWDDDVYVTENNFIKNFTAQNISDIFSTKTLVAGNYHPLTILSLAVDYHFFKLNPHPYHLENLIFHLINILLVFYLVYLLKKKKTIAIIVSLFFAIHPMHVESVSWVSERKDMLYSFFFLISLVFYVKYIIKSKSKFLLLSMISFLLSLYSKPSVVCLSVLIILIDYYYKRKFSFNVFLEKIPYFVLALIFGLINIHAQKDIGAFYTLKGYNVIDKFFCVCYSIIFYIYQMFVPMKLSAMHYYPVKNNGLLPAVYYLSFLAILLIVFSIYKFSKYRKLLIFGFLFYMITLALQIQLVPVGKAIVAERYSYISYIGLFFMVGQFYSDTEDNKLKIFNKAKSVFLIILIIYTSIFSYITWNRNKVWKDGNTLFNDVVKKYPLISEAHSQAAIVKISIKDYKGAFENADAAIKLKSNNFDAILARGLCLLNFKKYKEAIADFDDASRIKPHNIHVYNNRGIAKHAINDLQGALQDFSKIIEIDPYCLDAYINRRAVRKALGDYKGAKEDETQIMIFMQYPSK